MALNANAIITVAEAKDYIKLDGSADVSIFELIINGTSDLFEKYCNTKFIIISLTEIQDGIGDNKLFLEYAPMTELVQVKIDDAIVALTEFKYNPKNATLNYKLGSFTEGFQNIEIQYKAGYASALASLPADVRLAALKQCEYFYKRDSSDFSDTFEEGMIVRAPSELLSPTVREMLSPYFRHRI